MIERPSKKLCGIFTRKERWGLSPRGRLVLASLIFISALVVLFFVHPFLALTHRVDAKIMVVEGWVHEFTIRAAVEEYRAHPYEHVYTTGGPVEGSGGYINDFNTSASVGADLLKKNGLPPNAVQMVPSRAVDRDRSFSSVVALRDWFRENNISVHSMNVVTEDAHSRRTRLLFQKVFGDEVQIGVISVANPDYDAKRWWRYSAGVREVLGEGVAYLHARIFSSSAHQVEKR